MKLNHPATISIAATFAMMPNLVWAENSQAFRIPFTTDGAESINRLRDAYKDVQSEESLKALLKDSKINLSIAQRVAGLYSETTKFQSYYKGLEVVGDMAFHHRHLNSISVRNKVSSFDLDTTPRLSADEAVAIAMSAGIDRELGAEPALQILPSKMQSASLVYLVSLKGNGFQSGMDVIVSAHTGEILAEMSHHIDLAPVNVYAASSKCQTVVEGELQDLNHKKCDLIVSNSAVPTFADASVRSAAQNSSTTLNYYSATHARDSYDDSGAPITSIVHVGEKFANAFWDSQNKIMAYGDGDGETMGDMTLAVDVAGHEITHAVTSSTAKLMHKGESGALNEAYSDFFGKMIEGTGNWAIGKKLFKDPESKGIRYLSNPSLLSTHILDPLTGKTKKVPYPSKMSEKLPDGGRCGPSNDYCHVHGNATIPGRASYLVYKAIGKAKAETIYYTTLTQYLTSTADFADARDATVKVCESFYDSLTCDKVKLAFSKVGL